ncbi:hypothetical protein [Nonomuraea candida]|uniref:hypothetical protein n=1 Tax=Nonomuraea candida TaxID=359159 RepID=UPI001FE13EB3|nr:hypothetical protein [Nonomuraea candida]
MSGVFPDRDDEGVALVTFKKPNRYRFIAAQRYRPQPVHPVHDPHRGPVDDNRRQFSVQPGKKVYVGEILPSASRRIRRQKVLNGDVHDVRQLWVEVFT